MTQLNEGEKQKYYGKGLSFHTKQMGIEEFSKYEQLDTLTYPAVERETPFRKIKTLIKHKQLLIMSYDRQKCLTTILTRLRETIPQNRSIRICIAHSHAFVAEIYRQMHSDTSWNSKEQLFAKTRDYFYQNNYELEMRMDSKKPIWLMLTPWGFIQLIIKLDQKTMDKFLSRISFTFIPNLDLFAPNQLLGLQAIIRLLQLRNKSFQTIITAYPLQNVEEVKKAFFNSAYETYDCTWNHGHGKITIKILAESNEEVEWLELFRSIDNHVKNMIQTTEPTIGDEQTKGLVYIDDSLITDTYLNWDFFTKGVCSVHERLDSSLISFLINQFNEDADRVCLITDSIINSGYPLQPVTWGVIYGIPNDVHAYYQIRQYISGSPTHHGQLILILKGSEVKQYKNDPQTIQSSLLNENTMTLMIPPLTINLLEYWQRLGILFKCPDILRAMENHRIDVTSQTRPRDITQAIKRLSVDNIKVYPSESLLFEYSKEWIKNNSHPFRPRTFTLLEISDEYYDGNHCGRDFRSIGTISWLQLLTRHPCFPLHKETYLVIEVDLDELCIYVKNSFVEIDYPYNEFSENFEVLRLIDHHPSDLSAQLVELKWWEEFKHTFFSNKEIDSELEKLIKPNQFTGLVISLPDNITIEAFLDTLYSTFSLNEECLFHTQCYNLLGEECILLVDKLQLGFTRYVFDHWQELI